MILYFSIKKIGSFDPDIPYDNIASCTNQCIAFTFRGKFAVVKRCRRKQSGKEYAAKFLRKRRKGKDCRSDVIHEISMLEMVRKHPRLVDLVEVYETSHELILVTE